MRRLLPLCLTGCFWISEADRAARWDLDGDGVERPDDCDDLDPSRAALRTFYADADGDGFGDPTQATEACLRPEGTVDNGDDCDDANPAVYPGAEERCNGLDDDCDGVVDGGLPTGTFYRDADADGFGDPAVRVTACGRPEGYVALGTDCDDTNPAIHPDALEVCDGLDNDCDTLVDLDDPGLDAASSTWYRDEDGDGWGRDDQTQLLCAASPGWAPVGGDCRDDDRDVNPGADEVCDGVDNNCDDAIDVGAVDAQRWFADADEDGYGDPNAPVDACDQPLGVVRNASDCADDNPDVNPGQREVCDNGIDDDCDGDTDESDCASAAHTGDTAPGDTGP